MHEGAKNSAVVLQNELQIPQSGEGSRAS